MLSIEWKKTRWLAVSAIAAFSLGCIAKAEMHVERGSSLTAANEQDDLALDVRRFVFYYAGPDVSPKAPRGSIEMSLRSRDQRALVITTGDVVFTNQGEDFSFVPVIFRAAREGEYRIDCDYADGMYPTLMKVSYLLDGTAKTVVLPLVRSRISNVLPPMGFFQRPTRGLASSAWKKP